MKLVVSDTGPLNDLPLIGQIEILPKILERVLIPAVVFRELIHPHAPRIVGSLIQAKPQWPEVHETRSGIELDSFLRSFDAGERAAIHLVSESGADLVLMDDRVEAAAAQRGLLDLRDAFERLRETPFRYPDQITAELLKRFETDRKE